MRHLNSSHVVGMEPLSSGTDLPLYSPPVSLQPVYSSNIVHNNGIIILIVIYDILIVVVSGLCWQSNTPPGIVSEI